jgi:hypothetical protein
VVLPSARAVPALLAVLAALAVLGGCRSIEAAVPQEHDEHSRAEAVVAPGSSAPQQDPERSSPSRPPSESVAEGPLIERAPVNRQEITPIRVYPVPAGLRPDYDEVLALGGYMRALLGADLARDRKIPCDHPAPAEVEHLVHQYLEPMLADGVRLEVDLSEQRRMGAYYGRADILVRGAVVDFPLNYSSVAIVRGPTFSSRLSALDAQLASLASFPRDAVREASDRVKEDLIRRVQLLGLPYRVETAVDSGEDLHGWVEAVYRSIGVPDDEPDRWRFFLPPDDLQRYLTEKLHHEGIGVTVMEGPRTVRVVNHEAQGGVQVER